MSHCYGKARRATRIAYDDLHVRISMHAMLHSIPVETLTIHMLYVASIEILTTYMHTRHVRIEDQHLLLFSFYTNSTTYGIC